MHMAHQYSFSKACDPDTFLTTSSTQVEAVLRYRCFGKADAAQTKDTKPGMANEGS